MSNDVSEQAVAPTTPEEEATPEDEVEGSAGSVWVTVAFFVGFVVLTSGCLTLQTLLS